MTVLSERSCTLSSRCHQSLKIPDFGENWTLFPNQQHLQYEKGTREVKTNFSLSVSRQMLQNLENSLWWSCGEWQEAQSAFRFGSLRIMGFKFFIRLLLFRFIWVLFGFSSLFYVWWHLKKCSFLWATFPPVSRKLHAGEVHCYHLYLV
jgi:hypothetical protein